MLASRETRSTDRLLGGLHVAAVVGLIAGGVGCGADDASDASSRVDGRHVSLFTYGNAVPCAGTLAWLDESTDAAFAALGADVPDGFQVEVHFAVGEDFAAEAPCDDLLRGGCVQFAEPRIAWLQTIDGMAHELAHTAHLELWGSSSPALMEGVAELVGRRIRVAPGPPEAMALDVMGADYDDLDYVEAARLVGFLIDRFGILAFSDFFRAVGAGRDPSDASILAFGETVEHWAAEYDQAGVICAPDLGRCAGTNARVVDAPSFTQLSLACASPDVIGMDFLPPMRDEDTEQPVWGTSAFSDWVVDIPTSGFISIASDVTLTLNPCDTACAEGSVGFTSPDYWPFAGGFAAAAGRYQARLVSDGASGASVALGFAPRRDGVTR